MGNDITAFYKTTPAWTSDLSDSKSVAYHLKHMSEHKDFTGIDKVSAVLTARGRNQIKKGNFALAGRRYPIHDRSHAQNALARVSQHGTPSEKVTVQDAVQKRYPTMRKEAKDKMSKYKAYKKKQSKYLGSDRHVKNQAIGSFVGVGGATAIPTFMGTHFYRLGQRISANQDLANMTAGKDTNQIKALSSNKKAIDLVRKINKLESTPNFLKRVIAPTVLAGTITGGLAAHTMRKRIKKAFPRGPIG